MAVRSNLKKNEGRSGRRVLLVTPRYPFPVIGGDKLRVYNIVKYLSRFYSFSLASLYSTREEEESAPEQGMFEEVYRVRQPKAMSYCYTAGNLIRGKSLQSGYFFNPRLREIIDDKVGGYDLVLAHLFRVSDYLKGKSVPAICELTDAISMNYARAGAGAFSAKRLLYGFERKRCLEAERKCLEDFNSCVVVSGKDRDYLASIYPQFSSKLRVIPNGVKIEQFPYRRDRVSKGKIIFIGNMRTMQNADAACFFAKEVFGRIRESRPHATFWIIGAEPGKAVRALSSIPGVVVTGRVDDVRSFAYDAAASVCPIRIGAGIQNKVLESMAMGVPVVTTSVGAEGLLAEPGRHLLVADRPEAMKERVLELLNEPGKAEALSKRARALIEERYSWDGMLSSYRELVEDVLDGQAEKKPSRLKEVRSGLC